MRFVSLFAGVGGFDLGLEQAGYTCVGQVEIDKHAVKVLQKHWPNVPKHDDVQTAKEWADEQQLVGGVDLVCGGFPCQDLLVAGKRAGLDGARSGLFYDAVNFATHVKAKWIILENVPGLLSSNNGADFVAVISTLRNAGYSYIEWRVFNSQFYGVPQRRRRIYIVAGVADPSRFPIFVEREGGTGDSSQVSTQGENSSTEVEGSVGTYRLQSFGQYADDNTASADLVVELYDGTRVGDFRVHEGVAPTVISRYGTGGNNVPILEQKPTVFTQNQRSEVRDLGDATAALQASSGMNNTNYIIQESDQPTTTRGMGVFVKAARETSSETPESWREDEVSPTLNVFDNGGDSRATVIKVEPVAYDEYNDTISNIHHTLRAGTKQSTGVIQSVVRRLTPVECERLQGFPDDWTAGQSDSHRYKQMGNAVTVNVIQAIGELLKKATQ